MWEKFGCNEYEIVFLAVDMFEDANTLIQAYKNSGFDVEFPIIDKNNGAPAIAKNFGAENSGGPTYFVKPDKSYKDVDYSESTLTNEAKQAGAKEHECDQTEIVESSSAQNLSNKNQIHYAKPHKIFVSVKKSGIYSVSLYAITGKLILKRSYNLTQGVNFIPLQKDLFSHSVLLITVNNTDALIVKQKVYINE